MKKFYTVVFDQSEISHAVFTRYNGMGAFWADQIFGGGMTLPCGKEAAGKAVISPYTTNKIAEVTCKKCHSCILEMRKERVGQSRKFRAKMKVAPQ